MGRLAARAQRRRELLPARILEPEQPLCLVIRARVQHQQLLDLCMAGSGRHVRPHLQGRVPGLRALGDLQEHHRFRRREARHVDAGQPGHHVGIGRPHQQPIEDLPRRQAPGVG